MSDTYLLLYQNWLTSKHRLEAFRREHDSLGSDIGYRVEEILEILGEPLEGLTLEEVSDSHGEILARFAERFPCGCCDRVKHFALNSEWLYDEESLADEIEKRAKPPRS